MAGNPQQQSKQLFVCGWDENDRHVPRFWREIIKFKK